MLDYMTLFHKFLGQCVSSVYRLQQIVVFYESIFFFSIILKFVIVHYFYCNCYFIVSKLEVIF